ncbi:TPA: GMC family oxidoreductase [Stenotrophomonas maltophilia]|nr:GMC family oxidoreductase [Stenotrophomonas maltophilia]
MSIDMTPDVLHSNHDVVVIGSGLTGSWVAHELTRQGLNVLMLEAGPALGFAESRAPVWTDELKDRVTIRQGEQSRHAAFWFNGPDAFVDDLHHPYEKTRDFTWIRGRQVGGRSLTWGGVALRHSDLEFSSRGAHGVTWPIRHVDLAEYYEEIEGFMGVEGTAADAPSLPDGRYLLPNHPMTEEEAGFASLVQSMWPERRVVQSRVIPDPRGVPSADLGAWSARTVHHSLLPSAIATGRLTIRSGVIVSHLVAMADGRVGSVSCVDATNGQRFSVPAKNVYLSASTIESIRILLNSASQVHPNGIGNSGGLLGKGLLDKGAVSFSGSIPGARDRTPRPFGHGHGLLIPRFNVARDELAAERGFAITGSMQRGRNLPDGTANWSLAAQYEREPSVGNCVELASNTVDKWGLRTVKVTSSPSEADAKLHEKARGKLLEMISVAQYQIHDQGEASPGSFVHEAGGAAMGSDSRTSVVNERNQVWDCANLYVTDGSCFVTAGWQNPSLTMMAIALRAARMGGNRIRGVA